MIALSTAFQQELYYNRRNYLSYADITLASGTVLSLTNTEIWAGGFAVEDAVSDDDNFNALGSTIIGSGTLILDNTQEQYNDYDFTNAKAVMYVALRVPSGGSTRLEKIKKGTYTVDEASYGNGTVTMTLLDNMSQFDRPYSASTLSYPATLYTIVRTACQDCGVTLNTHNFPHRDYTVQDRPADDSVTYREVIGWAAAIAGCYARCNRDGQLELKWFDQAALSDAYADMSSTAGAVDGGSLSGSTSGTVDSGGFTPDTDIHNIQYLGSQDISLDDVVITGVRVTVDAKDADGGLTPKDYTSGSAGYIISVADNDFITPDTAASVAGWLGTQLIGLRFRKASVTHLNNPSIEAGDVGILWDRKGNSHPILITRTDFSVGQMQTTVSGAETPNRNSATRYTWQTKSYAELRKMLNAALSPRDLAIEALDRALASHSGLYTTEETTETGGTIFYMHDMPTLADSSIVWKMTKDAWGVTTDYKGDDTAWNGGMTVDGDTVVRLLSATGISADYLTTGRISDADNLNYWDLETGNVCLTGDLYTWHSDPMTLGQYLISGLRDGNLEFQLSSRRTYDDSISRSGILPVGYADGSGPEMTGMELYTNGFMTFYDGYTNNTYMAYSATGGSFGTPAVLMYADTEFKADVSIDGGLTVSGSKSRVFSTDDYSDRLLYCYEMPSPVFGDLGDGTIAEDGKCYITLDPIFRQTIADGYQVFLQAYGPGECFVEARSAGYFIVAGTPGLIFGWEVKAKQADYDQRRLERYIAPVSAENSIDYATAAADHVSALRRAREDEQ